MSKKATCRFFPLWDKKKKAKFKLELASLKVKYKPILNRREVAIGGPRMFWL